MNFRKKLIVPSVGFQIAPMVDIMLQALIFFMVIAMMARYETKITVTVPTADTGVRAARQAGEIIINIDQDGRIFINNVEMSTARLASLLSQVAKEFQDQPVIIRADALTRHEKVIGVLDICRQVDIWNIAFATIPGKTEP